MLETALTIFPGTVAGVAHLGGDNLTSDNAEIARRVKATHAPISIRQAVELIAKVAHTVSHAHEHGILHRDIKPGNILLDSRQLAYTRF